MALLLAVALLAACSKPSPASLPQGSQLLQQSGQAMGDVTSAHVDLKFDGFISSFISSAQGDMSREAGPVVVALAAEVQPSAAAGEGVETPGSNSRHER